MGKVKEMMMKAEEEVFEQLISGELSQQKAYEELLRLGHDEDSAYEHVYSR